jgi:hypothetical protein
MSTATESRVRLAEAGDLAAPAGAPRALPHCVS